MEDRANGIASLIVSVWGLREKRTKDALNVLAQATGRIESPSVELGKVAVGSILGRKIKSSLLGSKFEMSFRPPRRGVIIALAVGFICRLCRDLHLKS